MNYFRRKWRDNPIKKNWLSKICQEYSIVIVKSVLGSNWLGFQSATVHWPIMDLRVLNSWILPTCWQLTAWDRWGSCPGSGWHLFLAAVLGGCSAARWRSGQPWPEIQNEWQNSSISPLHVSLPLTPTTYLFIIYSLSILGKPFLNTALKGDTIHT